MNTHISFSPTSFFNYLQPSLTPNFNQLRSTPMQYQSLINHQYQSKHVEAVIHDNIQDRSHEFTDISGFHSSASISTSQQSSSLKNQNLKINSPHFKPFSTSQSSPQSSSNQDSATLKYEQQVQMIGQKSSKFRKHPIPPPPLQSLPPALQSHQWQQQNPCYKKKSIVTSSAASSTKKIQKNMQKQYQKSLQFKKKSKISLPSKRQPPATSKKFVKTYQSIEQRFKTELCRNFQYKGICQFGDKCAYAHGQHQLREKNFVSQTYKTRLCKNFHKKMYCPYGSRCQFVHSLHRKQKGQRCSYISMLETNQQAIAMRALITPKDNEEAIYRKIIEKDVCYMTFFKRPRLPVFKKITELCSYSSSQSFSIPPSSSLSRSQLLLQSGSLSMNSKSPIQQSKKASVKYKKIGRNGFKNIANCSCAVADY